MLRGFDDTAHERLAPVHNRHYWIVDINAVVLSLIQNNFLEPSLRITAGDSSGDRPRPVGPLQVENFAQTAVFFAQELNFPAFFSGAESAQVKGLRDVRLRRSHLDDGSRGGG